ncbi:hypothetical protein B0H66DRAFT_639559 [Apodospora peruviana]|uniref:Uncharacterized protein n=1 Tax=Apodospora peruviana TaxID=516989 RepID=A0AAE0I3V2_9PEZI|nr:hypothetical protein B0H66DRAFT_639559 [Apodospora peruviana]
MDKPQSSASTNDNAAALSTSIIAGAAVGIIVALALILLCLVVWVRRRHKCTFKLFARVAEETKNREADESSASRATQQLARQETADHELFYEKAQLHGDSLPLWKLAVELESPQTQIPPQELDASSVSSVRPERNGGSSDHDMDIVSPLSEEMTGRGTLPSTGTVLCDR